MLLGWNKDISEMQETPYGRYLLCATLRTKAEFLRSITLEECMEVLEHLRTRNGVGG